MSAKKLFGAVFLGASLFTLSPISCGSRCQTTRDCGAGQFCDFETGACIDGCKSGEECTSGVCDFATGRCRPLIVQPMIPDATTSSTSTTTDAGTSTISDGG